MELHKGETDGIMVAIAKEKRAFARLAAAAQACPTPKGKRLYNQLALDELKRLLELVSLMDGLGDEWLARLDLTLPLSDLPDPGPASDEAILPSTMEREEQSASFLNRQTRGVDREEILALLENLRTEEEDHRTRLRLLLHGLQADRLEGSHAAARVAAFLSPWGSCGTPPVRINAGAITPGDA